MTKKTLIIVLVFLLTLAASPEVEAQLAGQSSTHIINITVFTSGGGNVTSNTSFGHTILGEHFAGVSTTQNERFGFFHTTNKTLSAITVSATINVTLNNVNINGTHRSIFTINATATCIGGGCDEVTARPYFNLSQSIGTQLNATFGGIPFFNVSELVVQTCSDLLGEDASCSVNWTVNATRGGNYRWTINFTSSNTLISQNGTTVFFTNITACVETWEATGWVLNGTLEYRSVKDTAQCGTELNIPIVVRNKLAFWEAAVAILYVGAVGLYVLFGFVIKTQNLEGLTQRGPLPMKVMVVMFSGLKYLYLLTAPAMVLLGIHIAREIVIDAGASTTISDSLTTAFTVFAGIYVITLGAFVIFVVVASVNMFAQSGKDAFGGLNDFKKRRFGRNGKKES